MRVLRVIPAVAPRYGGPSHAIVGMSRALQQHNVDVLIATTDADGRNRLPVQLGLPIDWQGVPTIFFRRQFSEAWKYSRPLARWLDAHVAEFDVVHIDAVFSHASLAAAQASRRRRVPYIVRPIGSLDPWSLSQKPLRKRALWHFGVQRMLREAAAIHYTTRSERRLAEGALGLHHGVVISLGVDDAVLDAPRVDHEFRLRWPELASDPYVLILGRLHPKKAIDLCLDVFLRATPNGEQAKWHLVVAGEGEPEYVDYLKRWVREHGAEGRIVFAGWVSGMRKVAALQGASLLLLASHQENFGIVVGEALACGVPVLVSEQVNLADDIAAAHAGWVVSLEPSALVECLRGALERDDERLRRGANGREFAAAHFRWAGVGAELASLYGACSRRSHI